MGHAHAKLASTYLNRLNGKLAEPRACCMHGSVRAGAHLSEALGTQGACKGALARDSAFDRRMPSGKALAQSLKNNRSTTLCVRTRK